MENDNLNFYLPLRNLVSKLMTATFPILIISVIQLVRIKSPGSYGLITYWFHSMDKIPNDYKLLLYSSIFIIITMFFQLFNSTVKDKNEEPLMKNFILEFLRIIPFLFNLFTLLFFLYLIFYRGFWSFSELRSGFSFLPIIKFLFFSICGIYGYISFCHLFQLKKLIKSSKVEEANYYVEKHKLLKL